MHDAACVDASLHRRTDVKIPRWKIIVFITAIATVAILTKKSGITPNVRACIMNRTSPETTAKTNPIRASGNSNRATPSTGSEDGKLSRRKSKATAVPKSSAKPKVCVELGEGSPLIPTNKNVVLSRQSVCCKGTHVCCSETLSATSSCAVNYSLRASI